MSNLRVLLVDEDRRACERCSALLSKSDFTVTGASGLEEAAEAIELEWFDAVLLGDTVANKGLAEFTARLRSLERRQNHSSRVAVLSISPEIRDSHAWQPSQEPALDGYLPKGFEPDTLTLALDTLSTAVGNQIDPDDAAPIFSPDDFREQCANETELMVEIIDLFLTEQEQQLVAMGETLATDRYDRLSRLAHTLKGSLGALHASRARERSQSLELAAKENRGPACQELLFALEHDLEELRSVLLAFREQSVAN